LAGFTGGQTLLDIHNYIINTPARYQRNEPHLQWYPQIRPRITTPAGFEIGSGIPVNPSLPEDDAELLRQAG
jgi:UDPglucose--hexose-1-phosphate uridylyltransferase